MKKLVFKVIKQKSINTLFKSLDLMRKYPTHYEKFYQAEQILILLEYKPTKQLNEAKYITEIQKQLKNKYNAYSVELLGTPQKQINKHKTNCN